MVGLSSINGQIAFSSSTLTFTNLNWNVAQNVTLTAINDSVREGFHTDYISYAVTSASSTRAAATACTWPS